MNTGQILAGRYRLLSVAGSGTYGVVYTAQRLSDGCEVAVKTLRREMTRSDEVLRRFEQEAVLATRISHPNLIAVLDTGMDPSDGSLFIVQPLLRGLDLKAAVLREGRFAPRVAVDLMVPVLGGLLALHREGIVHRDVKPANIFLVQTSGGGVVPTLLDFGIAKFLGASFDTPRTITGQQLGTPAYMAPEQVDALRDIDGRCDVWAAGVVLFELITGRNPFLARSVAETLRRVKEVRAPSLGADAAPALAAIVERALEPDRARRWASMDALLGAIFDCPTIDPEVTGRNLWKRHRASMEVRHMEPDGATAIIPLVPLRAKNLAEEPDTIPTLTPWLPPSLVATIVDASSAKVDAVQLVEGWEPSPQIADVVQSARPSARPGRPRWIRGVAGAGVVAVVASVVALAAPREAGSYSVRVSVRPASATVDWNGARAGSGTFARELPRDGREHVLRIQAPGHRTHTVVFRDAPPPAVIMLSPE